MTIPVERIQFAAGQTYENTSFWCSSPFVHKAIASVTRGWPTRMTVTAHGIPDGVVIPVWIENAQGPEINTTPDTPVPVKRIDDNTLEIIDFNTGGQDAYVASSATLAYAPPVDMTDFIVRTQFRADEASEALLSLTSEDPAPDGWEVGFVITEAIGKVVMKITPDMGRAIIAGATKGIAQIEYASPGGDVYRPRDFKWAVTAEATVE